MLHAVLFKSERRLEAFRKKFLEYGVKCTILDFEKQDWISFDYSKVDMVLYYPSFQYTSNHPLALQKVHDNLMYIHLAYPGIAMFPDPGIIRYYNDKFRQFLFLTRNDFPMPETIPLLSEELVTLADRKLGYPMVIKNRYGAGGDSVFKINSRKELYKYFNISKRHFFNVDAAKYFLNMLLRKEFYYYLVKEKNAAYPVLSTPLLAQKFVHIDRDLKTVVGNLRVVEGHWRLQADERMWKMNIDGGGVGEWSYIPDSALEISVKLAKKLKARWLNLDLVMSDGRFLITEFSPVWHHYAYKEKPSFVYKADYNIDVPLEVSLDLERIIVESLISAVSEEAKGKR